MLNFPVPYPEELLYSTVARAGVHFGIISPKRLLDEAFGNRMVIATVDLPSHLKVLSSHYPKSLGLTPEQLAYNHTLLPLYAPFVPESRRLRCLRLMKGPSKGAAHLSLGIATSRIKSRRHFRVCLTCLAEQLDRYGEYYWERLWQAAGSEFCLKHAGLVKVQHRLRNYRRHDFVALSPATVANIPHNAPDQMDKRIEHRIFELLNLPPRLSPSPEQWGVFYRSLAHELGLMRGGKIKYDHLKERVLFCWREGQLARHGIVLDDTQSSWLRMIVRKHRKTFNYLEHIVILEALMGPEWTFADILSKASQTVISKPLPRELPQMDMPKEKLIQKRAEWLSILKDLGTRQGRLLGGDHIYTWLYRHDHEWLLQTNAKYRKSTRSESKRVDWHFRDLEILRRLKQVRNEHLDRLEAPRRSKTWYCQKAECISYGKKMDKLPLSSHFLERNCEGVAEYQIRRIVVTIQHHDSVEEKLTYSQLLRLTGLSESRMKEQTRYFLQSIGY